MPKILTSKGIFGSGGTLPALFTEDHICRPFLNRPRPVFYMVTWHINDKSQPMLKVVLLSSVLSNQLLPNSQ
jgi:hypothetical protein